ncbi:MAG TPA: M1 family aminopeptidase, partial [Chitinophagales bacterium]|nr:M1 family aminopeptidase [Chitinophagales bacterium]
TTKPIQIWTQGETESNSCWFPTIDKPNQKCTEEIYITHNRKYVSLSNGTLLTTTPVNDSMVTDHWKTELPFSPYLVMMAVGNFSIVHDRWRDIPVDYFVEPKYAPYAKKIFGNTPEMIEFFSQKLGFDFPWPKYDQVVVRDYVSGAMENVSATLHGEFLQRNSRELLDETYEDIISHELFHQWFGDLVTCESWSNIPLNESFATYGEYLWNEYKYGRDYADYKQYDDYRQYMDEAKRKNVDLIRFYYEDREDMFDATSYQKGGLVLHYLRKVVGDEAFFKSLELYLKTNQFKPVEIHNLRLAFEEVTGRDMNWFFNEWFLNTGHPELNIHYSYTADSLFVTIDQKHNIDKPLTYELPFTLGVYYGNAYDTMGAVLNKKTQTFAFKAKGKPDLVDFDPERFVLCQRTDDKTTDNYIFEYRHGQYFGQKYEALKKLNDLQAKNPAVKQLFIDALKDKFFFIRQYATTQVDIEGDSGEQALLTISQLAKNDKESAVRRAAIDKLAKAKNPAKYTALFEAAIGDSSYEVDAAALRALEKADSKKAMEIAKQLEPEKNVSIVRAVADVYAKDGNADYITFFENGLRSSTGYSKYSMFYYYANFLGRMDKNEVLKGIKSIEAVGDSSEGHFLPRAAKDAIMRIKDAYEKKKDEAQKSLANAQDKGEKIDLQEKISQYDAIISDAQEAAKRMNKKLEDKEE